MENYLAIINKVIAEHQTIRSHIKLVGDSIPDREALAGLEKTRADWVPGKPEVLSESQNKLVQAISYLEEGLRNHFTFEQNAFPPLLGDLFMRAILLDHEEIMKEIKEDRVITAETGLGGLSREDLLDRESKIRQAVDDLGRLIDEHAGREEVILDMLRRALEDKV
jgi:hypothetical protein